MGCFSNVRRSALSEFPNAWGNTRWHFVCGMFRISTFIRSILLNHHTFIERYIKGLTLTNVSFSKAKLFFGIQVAFEHQAVPLHTFTTRPHKFHLKAGLGQILFPPISFPSLLALGNELQGVMVEIYLDKSVIIVSGTTSRLLSSVHALSLLYLIPKVQT